MKTNLRDLKALPSRSIAAVDHAFLAAAVEQAADSVVITDVKGTIKYVNPEFTAMTGYTSEEAVGRNPRFLKSGLNSKAFYKELWETILSGRIWQGKLANRRKNGAIYYEEMRIAPVRGANGESAGFIAIKRDITDQQAAEEAQAFLAAIVENSEDSIIACTPEGTVRAFNRGAEVIFGYSANEVIGQHMSMFVPQDRLPALEKLAEQLRHGDGFSQYEGWCQRKDGRRFEVSVSGFPIKNAAGEVVAISNILCDITERKRADEALRESEERFRNMADSCPSMLWVTGPEGEIEFINRMYREFSGLAGEEARADNWRSLLHPDEASGYLAAFDRAMKEHTSFSAEARVRRADGEWRLVGSRGEPRFSPDGKYLGHIGLRADITERVEAEKLQEFQHSLISAIYEGPLDGILVVNQDNIVVSHNKKFLDVWKFSLPSIPENLPSCVVGIDQQPLLSAALQRVKDPETYLRQIGTHQSDLDGTGRIEVELKDGRIL